MKKHLSLLIVLAALMASCAMRPVPMLAQSAALLPVPKAQFFDSAGNPLAGGKVYSYQAGTTTPLATYTDSTGGTPNTNPVILDSAGRAGIWLTNGTFYKIVLKSSADVTIWTVDNVANIGGSAAAIFPISDSIAVIKNSSDGTKRIRFDASQISTGVTRNAIMPDTDIVLAGANISQTWFGTQTFDNVTVTGTCTGCGGGGGGGNPFSDLSPLVKNEADNTKQVRISAASVGTGQTRTLTAQNGDYIIAGLNKAAQTFTTYNNFTFANGGAGLMGFQNNHTTGIAGPEFFDGSGLFSGSIGWANGFNTIAPNTLLIQTAQPSHDTITFATAGVAQIEISGGALRPVAAQTGALPLGSVGHRWSTITGGGVSLNGSSYIQSGGTWNFQSGSTLNVSTDYLLGTDNTYNIGSNATRPATIYTRNLNVSGTCVGCGGGGGGNPFSDSAALVMNSGDNTKLMKFDLSGQTTGTELTVVWPNFGSNVTATMAFTDIGQTWTATQTYSGQTRFNGGSTFGSGNRALFTGGLSVVAAAGQPGIQFNSLSPADIGTSADRVQTIYTQNLNVSGTCTGCGGGSVTGSSPIVVSSGVVSCPTCVDTGSTQTITGQKTVNDLLVNGVVVMQGGFTVRPSTNGGSGLGLSSLRFGSGYINSVVAQTVNASSSYVAPNGQAGLSTTFQIVVAMNVCQQFTFSGGLWTAAGSTYAC